MAKYDIGDVIRDSRKRQGITQEELAYGICTASSLSKIENKIQVPSRSTFRAIMERLGEPGYLYSTFASSEDMKQHKLCYKIVRMLANYDMNGMEDVLKENQGLMNPKKNEGKQFFMYIRAIYHSRMNMEPKYVLEELEEALQVTVYGDIYARMRQKNYLLTFDEIIIWNNIAIQSYRMGQKAKAMKILYELKEYLDNREIDEEEKARVYPMIVCNIAGWMCQIGGYQESVELSDIGISICRQCGKLIVLPYLLHQKANSLTKLGRKKDSQKYLEQANNIFEIMTNHIEVAHREIEIAL